MSAGIDTGLIEMRPDERLDVVALEPFLADRLPDTQGPLRIRQFAIGAANLTYLLEYENAEYVLRRPPLGNIAAGAHDMERESRILANLYKAFPLAPRVFFFDQGEEVIGAPFFVMERKSGFVINKELPHSIKADDSQKVRLAWMLIDTLADLHKVDPNRVGLGELGRPEGYAQRQLEGWTKRWLQAEGDRYEGASDIVAYLSKELPKPQRISLLHNDYKLNNVIVDTVEPCTPTAVIDWDMCTRGDPLFDLGLMLVYWSEPNDDPLGVAAATMPSFADGGFPSRAEAIKRYSDKTGLNLDGIEWYYIFGIFKLMGILQQIYIRYERGQTQDQRFAVFDQRIRGLVNKARRVIYESI